MKTGRVWILLHSGSARRGEPARDPPHEDREAAPRGSRHRARGPRARLVPAGVGRSSTPTSVTSAGPSPTRGRTGASCWPPPIGRSRRSLGQRGRGGRRGQLPPQLHGARGARRAMALDHAEGRDPCGCRRARLDPGLHGSALVPGGRSRERGLVHLVCARRGTPDEPHQGPEDADRRSAPGVGWRVVRGRHRMLKVLLDEAPRCLQAHRRR